MLAFFVTYIITGAWGWIEYTYDKSISARSLGASLAHGLWCIILYISFWEWRWRLHYKESMISIKKGMGDDIISNLFLLAAKIFLWIIGSFMTFAIYMAFIHHS